MTQIRSEIPASVWQVKVAEGDQVEEGDELIILESMKMEIPVVAPTGGTVSVLHVKPDDRVQEGDMLAELA
jgi:acetyl-CoA carboxylase biotin carboxyl carrier protein